jgi:hypothetical protein
LLKFKERLTLDLKRIEEQQLLHQLQEENTTLNKNQERSMFDIQRMEQLMFKKDDLIKQQLSRIRMLEASNDRTVVVRLENQLEELELSLGRKEEELVTKSKITTHLNEELKENKKYMEEIVKNKEATIVQLEEEQEQERQKFHDVHDNLQKQLTEQKNTIDACKTE